MIPKRLRPPLLCVLFRWVNALLVQTQFDPDEFWQGLEPAHRVTFGRGHLTWEWEGTHVRSWLYPLLLSGPMQFARSVLRVTNPWFYVYLPRALVQGTLAGLADGAVFEVARRLNGGDRRVARIAAVLNLFNWFQFYCGVRTYANSFESCLTLICLGYFWPFPTEHERKVKRVSEYYRSFFVTTIALILIGCCVAVRPSSAVTWAVLGAERVARSSWSTGEGARLVIHGLGMAILLAWCLLRIDSWGYGGCADLAECFTPLNFLKVNFLRSDLSSFYGVHSFHWYVTKCLPAVFGLTCAPFLMTCRRVMMPVASLRNGDDDDATQSVRGRVEQLPGEEHESKKRREVNDAATPRRRRGIKRSSSSPSSSRRAAMRKSSSSQDDDVVNSSNRKAEEIEDGEVATKMILRAMAVVVTTLSAAPHKELRFALPLVGLANAVAARSVFNYFFTLDAQTHEASSIKHKNGSSSSSSSETFSPPPSPPPPRRRRSARYVALLAYIWANAVPALYLSLVHQRWPIDVAFFVAGQCERVGCVVDVLLPCHATPLYSHMDPNVPSSNLTISFVDCSPYSVLGTEALKGFKKVAPPFPLPHGHAEAGSNYIHDREWLEKDPAGFIETRYKNSRCRGEPFERLLVLTSSAHFPLVWGAIPGTTVFRHLATHNFNDIPARIANRYLPDKWKKDDVKVLVYECRG